jgi:rare lipoprotein A (peptidoglycan hydrolase)
MRISRTITTTLLTLLAATACMSSGVSALAATTAATGGASPAPAKAKVHKTSIATWFGPGFYGQQTACGQVLTPAVVGVANRTLPCGTLVKVTYHGHALVVPVLDRGPYANHADWDLTAGAAQALDITETVRIGTRVVGIAPNTPLLGSPLVTPAEAATGGAQAAG